MEEMVVLVGVGTPSRARREALWTKWMVTNRTISQVSHAELGVGDQVDRMPHRSELPRLTSMDDVGVEGERAEAMERGQVQITCAEGQSTSRCERVSGVEVPLVRHVGHRACWRLGAWRAPHWRVMWYIAQAVATMGRGRT